MLRRGHKLVGQLAAVVKDEAPSSENGKLGKRYALATLTFMDRSFGALASGVRARTAERLRAARGFMAKARSLDGKAGRAEKRARKYFKAAGVPIKRDPASA